MKKSAILKWVVTGRCRRRDGTYTYKLNKMDSKGKLAERGRYVDNLGPLMMNQIIILKFGNMVPSENFYTPMSDDEEVAA